MSIAFTPIETVVVTAADETDDDVCHDVCHCTDDRIAWCFLDVSDAVWDEEGQDVPCPLCGIAEESPTCPWGCACEECGS